MLDFFKKMKIKFITIPYWHNWTGPGARGGEPVTWLDDIARHHDSEVGSDFIFGAFKSKATSIQNIQAHLFFFARTVMGILTLFTLPYQFNLKIGEDKTTGGIYAHTYAAFNTVIDITVATIGVCIFAFDGLLNFINICIRRFGKINTKV